MKNIIVLLADGFEEIEALAPIDIWRRAKLNVTTISVSDSLQVTSQQKIIMHADKFLSEINENDVDVVFIPGGAGHKIIKASEKAMAFIDSCITKKKVIAAICAGPTILGNYLQTKKATCYPAMKELIPNWIDEKVVIDTPFVTGQGAGASFELGYTILNLLTSEEETTACKKQMVYKN
ncbi:MAG: DJ-1 family glyoxalase III [Brevinema sp.]